MNHVRRPAAELIAVGTLSDAFLIWLGMAGASAAAMIGLAGYLACGLL